ncbi:transcriptional adapter 3-like [Uloborus diversus]|uniref:transcriptional adapter 3-like n=1 Tax=Uloborus diversus TaxID=327109 RepID=UPI00240980AF|nr:transcriptional adapter 3-like [Uloborus diversus]
MGSPKQYPTLFSALQSTNSSFAEKDLEDLQFQFEDILSSTQKKIENLEREISLTKDKQNEKPKIDIEKRKSSTDRPGKKLKVSSSKGHSSGASHQKSKNVQPQKQQTSDFSEAIVETPKFQKPDNSNRFWSYLEEYWAEISQDDITTLEDWLKVHDHDSEYQTIPPLGEHYTSKWIDEDLFEEMKEGSKSAECPKGFVDENYSNCAEKAELLAKAKEECYNIQEYVSGSLTERLVAALVKGNLMTSLDNDLDEACSSEAVAMKQNHLKPDRAVSEILEKRLLRELLHNDYLQSEDADTDTDDELLGELKMLQFSLKPISEHNKLQKTNLLSCAKAEMKKQEVKMKLQECDAKVMESYRTMAAARSKKKKLSKKEQEQILIMLRRRSCLVNELEKM